MTGGRERRRRRGASAAGKLTQRRFPRRLPSFLLTLLMAQSSNLGWATVKPPVEVTLTSTTKSAQVGKPISVDIFISSRAEIERVQFRLRLSEGWELVKGKSDWTSSLRGGKTIHRWVVIRATQETFGSIVGQVFIPEAGVIVQGSLDLRDPAVSGQPPVNGVGRPLVDKTPEPAGVDEGCSRGGVFPVSGLTAGQPVFQVTQAASTREGSHKDIRGASRR